jgi:trafficking protein particle complex subunit 13
VGETFSCSLCANNELPDGDDSKVISSVRIMAEMQTPSQTIPLDLIVNLKDSPNDGQNGLEKGESLLKVVRFDLKEEGSHILAVSVSYSETSMTSRESDAAAQAASARVRTFRKLYQFIAQPCLSVRTKSSELPPKEVEDKSLGPYGKSNLLRFALEAQLENVGEDAIFLEVSHMCLG